MNLKKQIESFYLKVLPNPLNSIEMRPLFSPKNIFNNSFTSNFFRQEDSPLPIKINPRTLKKRPMTAGNSKSCKTPFNSIINFQTKNNFIPTPMKGIYRGYLEDNEEEKFRPIKVFGELAKIYK